MKRGSVQDVKVRIQAVIGEKDLSVRELSSIVEGSLIEFDSLAGEPVELRAGGRKIAWGEVVIIDENFGIRVTELERTGESS